MNINRVFLRFDADTGKNYGLGHFNRSLKIFKLLNQNKKISFFFILEKNNLGHQLLKKKYKNIIFFSIKNLEALNLNKNDLIIIDTLGSDKKFFNFLNKTQIKKISLDELNLINFKSGIVINGIFFAKKFLNTKNKNIKIYQGPKYISLDESFSEKTSIKRVQQNKVALITSGGADGTNLLYQISNYLLELKYYKKILVIIGPGVKQDNKIFGIRSKKLKLIKNKKNIQKYIDLAEDVFTSGGTVMFEALARKKVPNVVMTYKHQQYAINFFVNKKTINFLGYQKYLSFKKLNLNLKKKKQIKFISGRKYVDGLGIRRIIKIINKIII